MFDLASLTFPLPTCLFPPRPKLWCLLPFLSCQVLAFYHNYGRLSKCQQFFSIFCGSLWVLCDFCVKRHFSLRARKASKKDMEQRNILLQLFEAI